MRKSKFTAVICLLAIILQLISVTACAAQQTGDSEEFLSETPFVPTYKSGSYGEFLQENARTLDDIEGTLDVKLFNESVEGDISINGAASDDVEVDTYDGRLGIMTTEESFVEFSFNVATAGLYVLGIDYYTGVGNGSQIERKVYINGELQYDEARYALLDRNYVDETDPESDKVVKNETTGVITAGFFHEDSEGNQSRGRQVEKPQWITDYYFQDANHAYSGALKFYLASGENTVRIESVRDAVVIGALYFYTVSAGLSYSDFLLEKEEQGIVAKDGDAVVAKVQAEYPSLKNDQMLFASYDRASAATEPVSTSNLKLNIIGGDRWDTVGQWLEYKVNVKEAGLYKIALRFRQNLASGLFTSREITVNGERGYDECVMEFPYNGNWQVATPVDEYGEPVMYYFKEGENTIRVSAVAGQMTNIINAVKAVIDRIQQDYRSIVAITGSVPDVYQDYELETTIPETISDLKAQADALTQVFNRLYKILGEEGQQTAQLGQVVSDLTGFYENPSTIPAGLDQITNNVSALGDFITSCAEQPLEIDYIVVAQKDYTLPSAEAGVVSSMAHQLLMFVNSFTSNVNSISGEGHPEYSDYAKVWTKTARDYAILIRQIIDRNFCDEYNVDLLFQLFPGSLTNSILAGSVCDVMISQGNGSIIDAAARNVIYPLSLFTSYDYDVTVDGKTQTRHVEGFQDIKSRFHVEQFDAVTLEKEKGIFLTYGVPETIGIGLYYYRSDIVDTYGLWVPDTWDDYYDLIPIMQKYSMQMCAPNTVIMLYQYGGTQYKNGGREVNFDSDLYLEIFDKSNEFYNQWKSPISFDGFNRFKTGEMPFMEGNLGTWTQFIIFCPEVRGLYEFTIYPGVEQEDGSVNRDLVPTGNYSMMLMLGEHKEEGWRFIQWWTDADTQVEYGRECESLIGATARYSSANVEAFNQSGWSSDEFAVLRSQFDNLRGAEVCVGDFYSARYISFATTEAIVERSSDGHSTILTHIKEMNDEILRKRTELHLPE